MNGSVCLARRERRDESEREEDGWEKLIVGSIVIRQVRNVFDKHMAKLLSSRQRLPDKPYKDMLCFGLFSLSEVISRRLKRYMYVIFANMAENKQAYH